MTWPVLTIGPGQTASDALALMRDENVRHAVVMLGSSIVGVVSDRDLGGPRGGLARRHQSVGDLMSEDPTLASPGMAVEDAVHLVLARRLECLPVVSDTKLVGIVTRSDLLRIADPDGLLRPPLPAKPPPDDDDEVPPTDLFPPERERRP